MIILLKNTIMSSKSCIICSNTFENKITNCYNCFNFNCCKRCFIYSFIETHGNIKCPSCFHNKFSSKLSYEEFERILRIYIKICKLENNEVVEIINEIREKKQNEIYKLKEDKKILEEEIKTLLEDNKNMEEELLELIK